MTLGSKTRQQLLAELPWKPIRGCPGRLVLDGLSERTVEDLAGLSRPASVSSSPVAPDPVVIVQLADGGLISYRKPDGRYLHTLATPEAFERKVRHLGFESFTMLRVGQTTLSTPVADGAGTDGRTASKSRSSPSGHGLLAHRKPLS